MAVDVRDRVRSYRENAERKGYFRVEVNLKLPEKQGMGKLTMEGKQRVIALGLAELDKLSEGEKEALMRGRS